MKRKINLIWILICIVLLVGCSIKKPSEYYNASSGQPANSSQQELKSPINVTLSIRCDTILNNMDKLDEGLVYLIPKDGVILNDVSITVNDLDTAQAVLLKASKQNSLLLNTKGSGDSAYLSGINGIKEYSCGSLSGWKYRVNGEFPSVGYGAYELREGDIIEFLYTCDLGADLE